jgi:hypothetical protein
MVKVEQRFCLPAVSFGDVVMMGEEIADPEKEIRPPTIVLVTAVATGQEMEVVGSPCGRRCVPLQAGLVSLVVSTLRYTYRFCFLTSIHYCHKFGNSVAR